MRPPDVAEFWEKDPDGRREHVGRLQQPGWKVVLRIAAAEEMQRLFEKPLFQGAGQKGRGKGKSSKGGGSYTKGGGKHKGGGKPGKSWGKSWGKGGGKRYDESSGGVSAPPAAAASSQPGGAWHVYSSAQAMQAGLAQQQVVLPPAPSPTQAQQGAATAAVQQSMQAMLDQEMHRLQGLDPWARGLLLAALAGSSAQGAPQPGAPPR